MDNLPTFEDCKMAIDCMNADPIEVFIYENEPAGVDAVRFRKSLQDALYFFCTATIANKVSLDKKR